MTTKGGNVLLICRVCGSSGQDAIIAELQALDLWPRPAEVVPFPPAGRAERKTRGPAAPLATEKRYEIKNLSGLVEAIKVRREYEDGSKDFVLERPGGRSGLAGRKPASLPLYGTEMLAALPDGATVVLHEGEKAAEAGRKLGLTSLGTVTGADTIPDAAVIASLKRFDVCLWRDEDEKGIDHMRGIAAQAATLGISVRMVDWSEAHAKDDAAEFLERGGTPEAAAALIAAAKTFDPHAERLAGLNLWSAERLYGTTFAEPRQIVPTLLTEGVTILAGRPKLGKSRLILNIAIAVACGGRALGTIEVDQGKVLYAALEDGARRTSGRAQSLAAAPPPGLTFAFEWRRLNEGGLEDLDAWCSANPGARMVVLDTAQRIRPKSTGRQSLYVEDYEFLAPLNDLATKHRICIVVVHHTKKGEAEDPLEMISGSNGLTGAVDGALILKRERGRADATLHVVHRDMGDAEYALEQDDKVGSWSLVGDAKEYRQSSERSEILNAVRDAGSPVGPKIVAEAIGKRYDVVAKTMARMAGTGDLKMATYGKYTIGSPTGPTGPTCPTGPSSPTKRETWTDMDSDWEVGQVGQGGVQLPNTRDGQVGQVGQVWRCSGCESLEWRRTHYDTTVCDGCGRPAEGVR